MVPLPQPGAPSEAALVDVLHDFLRVHRMLRALGDRFRAGGLRFDDVRELVGDREDSLLFRLKERCHALFRARVGEDDVGHEALFDLAVGALFHEAMKLRETLYQQSVYGPRVRALRRRGAADAEAPLRAFEAMLTVGASRLAESVDEVETLLAQTLSELRALLAAHRDNGHVARFLVENPELVESAFGREIDDVLTELHGSAGAAWRTAARSWLRSGHFGRAASALGETARRGVASEELERSREYAEGMQAYLDGRYRECLEHLDRWFGAGLPAEDAAFADQAYSAVSRLAQWIEREPDVSLANAAAQLAGRLRPARGAS